MLISQRIWMLSSQMKSWIVSLLIRNLYLIKIQMEMGIPMQMKKNPRQPKQPDANVPTLWLIRLKAHQKEQELAFNLSIRVHHKSQDLHAHFAIKPLLLLTKMPARMQHQRRQEDERSKTVKAIRMKNQVRFFRNLLI